LPYSIFFGQDHWILKRKDTVASVFHHSTYQHYYFQSQHKVNKTCCCLTRRKHNQLYILTTLSKNKKSENWKAINEMKGNIRPKAWFQTTHVPRAASISFFWTSLVQSYITVINWTLHLFIRQNTLWANQALNLNRKDF